MKESARNYECKIMEKVMKKFNQPILYKCKNGEKLEGGDFMINCNTAFLGTGPRSNMNAAKKLLKLNLFGTQKVVIIYPIEPDNSMYRIHLDCIFFPFGNKRCLVWNCLFNSKHKRVCIEYILQNNNMYKKQEK